MIGQTIAHYRILEQLGQGGMGVVYKAEDTKLQRTVALKFLPESYRTLPEARAQLLSEARAASRLTHPNIVTIHSVEESDAGDFIVMEYVEGGTLRSRKENLTLDQIVELMIQTAAGLGAAHERNIVHRDIKPENLLLDSAERVKVSDFGLARIYSDAQRSFHTRTIAGTPSYMAPEQVLGESIDARTDIFCFGAVFYEIISGHRPFEGDHDMAVLYAVVNAPHVPLTESDSSVPAELSAIIDRCLAKAPAHRFENCGQLAAALEELRRGDSIPYSVLTKIPLGPRGWHQMIGQPSTPLVGRSKEVEAIQQRLESLKSGQGFMIFFTGESGVGKTRLAEKALRDAREAGMGILSGRCLPHGGGFPYHPYASALRSGFPRLDEQAIRPLVDRASALGVDLADRLPILKSFLTMSGGVTAIINQEQLWDSLLVLFRLLASGQSLVLLLDDLQWADEDTLRFMSFLARSTDDLPLLQIGTYRPVGQSEPQTSAKLNLTDVVRQLHAERRADVFELCRLTRRESLVLALQFMGNELDPGLADVIAQRSDGNPLFVKELTEFVKKSDAYGDPNLDPIIPARVRDTISQRIERLNVPERELLELAACEPEFFDSEILLKCLKGDRIALLRQLQTLESGHRLIRHIGTRYRFDHPLIRDVVYESILPELRAAYHGMIAETLIRRPGETDEHASRIAHHLTAAGDKGAALPYLLAAAERASQLHAHEEARRLYTEVAAIISGLSAVEPGVRLRCLIGLGDEMTAEGHFAEALERYTDALAVARQSGDPGTEVDVLRRLAVPHRVLGDFVAARQAAELAVAGATALRDSRREVECLTVLAASFVPRSEYGMVLETARSALELAERKDYQEGQSIALALMGTAHLHRGEYRNAIIELERAITLQRAMGDQKGLALSQNYAGLAYHRNAQFSKSLAAHQESLRIKRALADYSAMPGGLNGLGDLYRDIGQLDKAIQCHSESLEMARRHSNRGAECDNLRDLGADYLTAGDLQKATAYLNEAKELAGQRNYLWYEIRARLSLSEIHLLNGDFASAEAESRRGLALAEPVAARELIVEANWTLGRLLAQRREYRQAVSHLREAIDVARSGELLLPLWQIYSDLSCILAESGDDGGSGTTRGDAVKCLRAASESLNEPELREVFLHLPRARSLARELSPFEPSGSHVGPGSA